MSDSTFSESRSCEHCSRPLKNEPRFTKKVRFCSVQCSAQSRSRKVERVCLGCGDCFYTKASLVERGEGLFCKRACYLIHKEDSIKKEVIEYVNMEDVKMKCEVCKSIYSIPKKFIGTSWSRYCSDTCLSFVKTSGEEAVL